jgi:hypothetical protein
MTLLFAFAYARFSSVIWTNKELSVAYPSVNHPEKSLSGPKPQRQIAYLFSSVKTVQFLITTLSGSAPPVISTSAP